MWMSGVKSVYSDPGRTGIARSDFSQQLWEALSRAVYWTAIKDSIKMGIALKKPAV
jgi:hypothetical protein